MANRQIHIVELPKDKLGPEHFRLAEAAMPQAKDGEVLLQTKLISLDAANRAWMQGATYRAAVRRGQVMAGGALAEVVESRRPASQPAISSSPTPAGRTTRRFPQSTRRKLPTHRAADAFAERLRHRRPHRLFRPARMSAKPKAGETVVVSAAAGSVGVDRRPDREDQRLPRRRHRGRREEMRTGSNANSASTRRSTTRPAAVGKRAEEPLPERHRRLFRQCRRRHSRSLPLPHEQSRPHRLLRRGLAIRRRRPGAPARAACPA